MAARAVAATWATAKVAILTPARSLVSPAGARELSTATMAHKVYLGCAVYVSEARDTALLRRLQAAAAAAPGAHLANLFVDEPYNRTNFTLVGASVPALAAAAVELARAALAAVDLRQHVATHPRLGAVDHISCHPLPAAAAAAETGSDGSAADEQQQQQQQQQAAALARSIAQQLGAGSHAVPVLTYGWAHPQQRRLADVRRQLGYFRGAAAGSWAGALQGGGAEAALGGAAGAAGAAGAMAAAGCMPESLLLPLPPCYGPPAAPARAGVCCVGATPWIVNYNVLLHTDDLAAARHVARALSERGGGLAGVQAMALPHTDGIEVACNLLDPRCSPPAAVLAEVQRLAGAAGLEVGPAYRTNKAPEELAAAAAAAGL